ncbi:hypothetical protein [Gilliamella apis]|uniref:hypothetical protein n=1 Tax=Gilliamella apis TaxID=1970738 RepID=UPI00242EFE8D|nr:hypothetical protein [Gilliamella apis]
MYNVVDDLSYYYDNKKADYEKFCQEITKPFEIPPVIDYQLEDNYKKKSILWQIKLLTTD